ncbi:TetR/AcrR family transcriptional regulator [Nocardioides sp.]|uniref:TetR/AcrR family transcriptional regulator n=1 Tax=Nocardioides sp. TaxID=35761 RepID=UPI00351991A2
MTPTAAPTTRRERQREATFAEIVEVSRALLREGAELSLRAVAGAMGMTAPALYRYVASYQELVDLVAFEVDKAATARFAVAADAVAPDDHVGRLLAAATEFRRWALANPHEFTLVFANPVAESACLRREMITVASSGVLFTDLILEVWLDRRFPVPALEELPESMREVLADPLMPAKVEKIAAEDRGLVWIYMQGWTQLYGIVALEVMGHLDPRVIDSGEMYLDVISRFAPTLGIDDAEMAQRRVQMRAQLALPWTH